MSFELQLQDYEPVKPSNTPRGSAQLDEGDWTSGPHRDGDLAGGGGRVVAAPPAAVSAARRARRVFKRGHALSYAGLFLFTCVLYLRPYEWIPALSSLTSLAFWVAIATLLVFFPAQLALEGNLTARPREVNLVLLFMLAGLLSIPLAIDRGMAWETFTGNFVKAHLMFIVMVNAVRTERRLRWLLLLALVVGCFLSVGALQDYQNRDLVVENFRIEGRLGGMFENPNELGINLVLLLPIAVAFMLGSRSMVGKLVYSGCALLMVAATVATYSRASFLGLAGAAAVLVWRIRRRHRLLVPAFVVCTLIGLVVLAPGGFADRMISILDHGRDATSSASTRQNVLLLSIKVMLRHPLLGLGLRNFEIVSIHGLVTHNAYTQVATEMGIAAMVVFFMLFIHPYKRLREIERELSAATGARRKYYYLAVGLQASIVGYMVNAFFISSAYQWYTYYLIGYAVCVREIYYSLPPPADEPPGATAGAGQGRGG